MQFEWDDQKAATNFRKHGIRFEEAALIFQSNTLTQFDNQNEAGEDRFVSIGMIRGAVLVVVVHTDRDGVTRLISARRASSSEQKQYNAYIKENTG